MQWNIDLWYQLHFVIHRQSWCPPNYSIQDANRQEVLTMKGPVCMITGPCCPNDIDFDVRSFFTHHSKCTTVKLFHCNIFVIL